jgi:transposase
MSNKKHIVVLEQSDEARCEKIVRSGKSSARTITRARILLMTNEREGLGKKDEEVREALGISESTMNRTRKRYKEGGLEKALYELPRSGKPKRITKEDEAMTVAIACTEPPDGYGRWTLRLIQKTITEKIGKKIGKTTVDEILLKNDCKPWLKKNVVHTENNRRVQKKDVRCAGSI